MSIVYLAGSIAGLTGEEAREWRFLARDVLESVYQIDVRDPLRGKEALGTQSPISTDFTCYKHLGLFYESRAIMIRDFNDVKQADVLLVNLLGAVKPSLGTIMELAWAYAMQKPAIVVIEESGNPHDNHPMIHEAMGFRVTSLDEGIKAVALVLGKA